MKKYFYLAVVAFAFASCASDDYTGENEEATITEETPISLNLQTPALTRATGVGAAKALGNQFIIWGEKNEDDGTAAAAANQVMMNYVVNYTASTAYTTTSNTKDWEYVAQTPYATNVTPAIPSGTAQTIKYWDYGATNYVFTAVSAKKSEISSGAVKITKTTSGTTKYLKGYTIDVTADATVDSIYFSDRNEIAQGTETDRTATNKYGGNATMTFRNAMSKIRVGIYETIPGYKISSIKFYTDGANATAPAFSALDDEAKVSTNSAFGAAVPNAKKGVAGKLTVTYNDKTVAATENQAKVTFAPTGTAQNDIVLGTNMNTVAGTSGLATTASAPTYDTASGAYTYVYPQPENATNMKIKCDYKLTSLDTGEEINVTGATAEIPAQYLQWKANYTYTYLLKISDNTGGQTGGDITGLYPITLDAITVEAADGTADYITTVSEPSITTFGVSSGKYVSAAKDEYAAGTDVYATIVEGGTVKTPTIGTNVNIYTLTAAMTEAEVAEAIANTQTSKYSLTNSLGTAVTVVPTEDGKTVSQHAVKMASLGAGTYAIEYKATASWTGSYDKVYKVITVK